MFQQPQKRTLRDLLKTNKIAIPIYQRGYAWGEEEIDDFVGDIEDLWKATPSSSNQHFLGTMLCYSRVDEEWGHVLEVIDGQQRLTTSSMLIVAFREAAKVIASSEHAGSEVKDEAIKLMKESDAFVSAKQGDGVTVPKLSLNEKDNDDWMRIHREGVPLAQQARRSAAASVQNLNDAYETLSRRLIGPHASTESPAACVRSLKELSTRLKTLLDGLSVVLLTAESEKDVYDLFMVINDRGKPLSPLDLLRTGTLSKLKSRKKAFDKANLLFAPLLDVDEAESKRALTHYVNSHAGVRVAKNALLKRLSAWLYNGEGLDGFPDRLLERTEALSEGTQYLLQLSSKEPDWFGDAYPFGSDKVGAERQHRLVAALGHESAKPLLVAGSEVLGPNQFRELLGVLERIATRSFVTGGVHKSTLADFHIQQARLMRNDPTRWSPQEMWLDALAAAPRAEGRVVIALAETCPDERMMDGLRALRYRGNRGLIAYIMLAIDSFDFDENRPGKEAQFHWGDIHLDHIVPQALEDDDVNLDGLGHTLGNLTPLSGSKNSSLKKMPYGIEKAKVYKQSKILMTRSIGVDYASWTPDNVRARTEEIAKAACRVWSLKASTWK